MIRKILFIVLSFFLFLGIAKATIKAPVDVTKMSITDLKDAMEKGYLTSELLVKIYLERIETYDSLFNSINQLNDKAIEEAKELDKMREEGNIKGSLHGIPILIKSNIDVVGLSTNAGTKALNENYPINNSYAVQKLVDAGAIILGSCNMSALAFSAQTSYSSFGYVKNAFDITKSAYGSSGGSAVAIAAGFAAASLGTDTNSSVRAPASGAGLVGIRPTYGLISHSGVVPYDFERDTIGVLTRNVLDNALILEVIAGVDENDETTKDAIVKKYSELSSVENLRIGVLSQYVEGKEKESGVTGITDSSIYNLLTNSIQELDDAGVELISLDKFVKYDNLSIAASTQAGGTMCDYFNDYIKGTEGPIKSFKDLANSNGTVWNLSGYLESCGYQIKYKDSRDKKKAIYEEYVASYFEDYDLDVLLYPTVKSVTQEYNHSSNNLIPGNSLGSVIGYPSITVSMGKTEDGLTYGIEFLAQKYKEDVLYNVASLFEKVNGNVVEVTPLAPSLYDIDNKVLELKDRYEEVISDDVLVNDLSEWVSEVKRFYKEYNEIDDVSKEADVLLDKYNKAMKLWSDSLTDKSGWYYGLIFIIVLCSLIIVKELCLLIR